jgi:anti-sigma regulatory factor (Ser/Thr protein kinase)
MGPIRISVPGAPRYVATLRLVVGGLARHAGCDDDAVADLKLAVSELATAAVEAGSDVIEVSAELDGDGLVVRLPTTPPHPDQLFDPVDIAKALVDGCVEDPVNGEVALTVLSVAGRQDSVG